ncbi:hypothetical protein ABB37_08718 [Leptomonas pyrrhocoris]|uniref:Uncharacterized protein n=1 Tax=Leptomonas pyrrhocoris TaxID=157538 RepID=A0A0M9FSH4_LEPPY|nr:hypothetical protein ABB37_08718 [Leptomonas pyrrhocoris]KPA75029.1 hypothetical protein ABB37_08718 [Leptomonas pyrrhocoris]|eukprot:XP_015653468.1 hypothetical protein ABB37_08718 [Leptomonas pyrrhocoris]
MMRRLRVSAACPRDAARTRMTGFNLFTQETQRQRRVLKSKNMKDGRKNMQIMSSLWEQLTQRRREIYNERARQRNALKLSDPVKKNNTFNLIMRLFGAEKIMLNAGDEAFIARIAKSTMQVMNQKDNRKLRAKLKVEDNSAAKGKTACSITSAFKRFSNPHMMFFDSFTEMQRSVAPTRKIAFSNISKLVSLSNVSESGEEYVIQSFNSLSADESNLFSPISDVEAPYFEVFCATRCGNMDYKHFNILHLFAMFRGIEVYIPQNQERERLYRSLLSSYRAHDGVYYRARRCLERLEAPRSSDCGLYITKRTPAPVKIAPSTYGIEQSWDDVSVATVLAETRHEQSVYDDILVRAALLRSEEKNALLDLYQIRLEGAKYAANLVRKVAAAAPEEEAMEEDFEDTVKAVRAKRAARTKTPASHDEIAVVPARSKAAQKKRAVSRTAEREAASPMTRTSALSRAKKNVRSAASSTKLEEKRRAVEAETAVEESEDKEMEVAAVRRTSSTKKSRVLQPSMAAAAVESELSAEDFMAVEEVGAEEEEAADAYAAALDEDHVENSEEREVAAPARKGRSEKRRSARSRLTDPAAMLPAEARVQKLVTKHSSARRKVLPITTAQAPPCVPPRRNADFTASIRALLSGSM